MKVRKRIGIWMDRDHAHLKEYHRDGAEMSYHEDALNPISKLHVRKGESVIHNIEQPIQTEFYKSIAREILGFNDVLLFGPSDAKTELFDLLKDDRQYADIKIKLQNSGRLSEKQERTVIRSYFN